MHPFQKFRRYEFWFILLVSAIYITRRLFQIASQFDRDVELAEHAILQPRTPDFTFKTSHSFWQDLALYNHELNTILPTIAGGILFLAAWYVFHYLVAPRWKAKGTEQTLLITYLAITILFCFGSVFVYEYFKLYWRFRFDSSGQIIGFKVFSLFRKLYLLTDTAALLVILVFYELFMQFYYFIKLKLEEEPERNYQYLDYLLVTFLVISTLTFSLVGHLPINFWNSEFSDLLFVSIILTSIYAAQQNFFTKVLPYIADLRSKSFSANLTGFLAICGIGSICFYTTNWVYWSSNNGRVRVSIHPEDFFLAFFFIVIVSIIVAFLRNVFFKDKLQLTTLFTQKTAELSSLRSQINPHFLFNALNTLYSVSLKENAEKTADGIQKLGDMMRFMLNENNQERILLNKEIEYLQNYIEIQQMRIAESDNIDIKVNIQPTHREIFIAPMLLNPFIENAFKHGISFRNPSWIYITLTSDDTRLYFKVHNSLHMKSEADPEKDNNGIGLENVQKRLDLIYKNRYNLDIQHSEQDFFVSLTITYW